MERNQASGGGLLGSAGGLIALLFPKGMCPLCLSAAASLLSSLGIDIGAAHIAWLLPALLAASMSLAVLVAIRRRRRRERAIAGLCVKGAGHALIYGGWRLGIAAGVHAGVGVLLLTAIHELRKWRRWRKGEHRWQPL